jgi:hypothetical protein
MAITDLTTNEVRLLQEHEFTQSPNFRTAGEILADGQFVYLSTSSGRYLKASQDIRATHLVLKSGMERKTASEISTLFGTVQTDEPVLAVMGTGMATIPFGGDVAEGQDLTLDANGYAVPWDADSGDAGAFIVGKALETVVGSTTADRWGDALLTLPAQYSPRP